MDTVFGVWPNRVAATAQPARAHGDAAPAPPSCVALLPREPPRRDAEADRGGCYAVQHNARDIVLHDGGEEGLKGGRYE